ncbi:unnamed protein product [Brassica napus]|uniref:(rape) hypothetical protein n=1 Tax=Brassica napus TaxID=3708 RepID=A0A816WLJ3_BRANA|nr:unnamed protein product [Brassica napus]
MFIKPNTTRSRSEKTFSRDWGGEATATGAIPEMSTLRLNEHKVLLLQQLQPLSAPLLLQIMQEILDKRWNPKEHSCLRRLPENKRSTSSATRSLRTTPEPASHDGKAFSAASFGGFGNNEHIDLSLAFALLNKQPPGSSSQLGFPSEFGSSHQSDMESVFATSQQKENTGYVFGNGSSGLEMAMSDPNKVLWGFPWQVNGEMNMGGGGGGHVDHIDSGREIWTNMNYINSGALM